MGAAHACLRRKFGLTRGTVLRFFIGKMDQGMAVLWSKTEVLGHFTYFFHSARSGN